MKKINKGIVFSNDIERILNGYNAYNYQYGLIPNSNYIEEIRKDFNNDVSKIFNNNITIISEEEMLEINNLIIGDYPHCNFR